jgi:uncharacterized phage protein gp47/JayE
MACDTILRPRQTITERKEAIKKVIENLDRLLASGSVKVAIGPQGAVAFSGLNAEERDGVTDACAYRRIMTSGSALAKAKIARAELMSGRTIDRQKIAQGWHTHDGKHWHEGH